MIRFDSPIYIWLLLLIPVMTLLMMSAEWQRVKNMKKLGDRNLIQELMPDASKTRRWVKFIFVQMILAIVILMLARPQMGTKVTNEKRNGIEAIICLDISNSMLAEDVTPSRLDKSKMLIENMVDKFSNDKVGLIVFAGDAFVQLPITSDYVSAKMFLQNIDPSLIQTQGTDIAHAIELAMNSFTQQDKIGKAIIVITDGEDHEGGAMEAAKAAKAKGMNVFILGIGNTSGAPIPTGDGGYMTDNAGQTVMTALNEQMCRDIASAGEGTYIHVDNTSSAQEMLNDELTKLQQGEMKSVIYSEYNEQFQAFGIIAILLIIIELCINEAVNPYFRKMKLFKRRNVATLFLLMFCFGSLSAQNDRSHIRLGNREFRGGNASKAEVEYRKALGKNNSNPQAMYNLGCALMQQQKDSLAMVQFGKAAKAEKSKLRQAMSYHNMGTILQRHQQFGEAIKAYEEALRRNPNDDETRYNLVLCKRQQKQQKDDNKNQDKKNQDKKDQQQQQQNQDKNDKKDEQQKQQPKEQMSKDNAEQLLNAAMQEEKNTQQRMKKAMQQPQHRNLQKNW
ncbi:MAG: VWA domain-containing protein [Prevotella sp.]|nr:VWA domain-containing protein [Prevotella sp.]